MKALDFCTNCLHSICRFICNASGFRKGERRFVEGESVGKLSRKLDGSKMSAIGRHASHRTANRASEGNYGSWPLLGDIVHAMRRQNTVMVIGCVNPTPIISFWHHRSSSRNLYKIFHLRSTFSSANPGAVMFPDAGPERHLLHRRRRLRRLLLPL